MKFCCNCYHGHSTFGDGIHCFRSREVERVDLVEGEIQKPSKRCTSERKGKRWFERQATFEKRCGPDGKHFADRSEEMLRRIRIRTNGEVPDSVRSVLDEQLRGKGVKP